MERSGVGIGRRRSPNQNRRTRRRVETMAMAVVGNAVAHVSEIAKGRRRTEMARWRRKKHVGKKRVLGAHVVASAKKEGAGGEPTSGKNTLDAAQKKMAHASKQFRKLGYFGFWSQLVLSVVSAVILVFSVAFTTTSQTSAGPGLYLTLFGILAGFFSMFWSFGYTRISRRLRKGAFQISEAPARAQVVRNLATGITINCAGLLSGILGLQSTVGLLVAKTLTSATVNPFLGMGTNKMYNPVMALDVFLVQACANSLSCHIVGLLLSLWLLRDVAKPAAV